MKNVKVWYLYHSGFALQIDQQLLVFDYYFDKPMQGLTGLSGGIIAPEDLAGLDVSFFVSHGHHDHFNPTVFAFEAHAKRVTYIFSHDVHTPERPHLYQMNPHETLTLDHLHVKTLASNDLGVAFYVTVSGVHIFHAGDLNWWHWDGEPEEWNANMARIFKEELAHLNGLPIDIAFIPTDPRLGAHYALGLDYFLKTIAPKDCTVFPMHFSDKLKVFTDLKTDGYMANPSIQAISIRGQMFELKK